MSFEPKIVGLLCNWCSYTGADLAGTSRLKYAPNVRVVRVMCSGCRMCNDLCPYAAIGFDEKLKVSSVNAALCKACGTCVAGCPAGAIRALHFSDEQVYAEIEGILV